jgi:hypothetical protein
MVNWKLASPLCVADTSLRRASNGSTHPHFPCCSFHWIFPFIKKFTGYSDQQDNGSKLLSTESLLRYTVLSPYCIQLKCFQNSIVTCIFPNFP